MAFEIGKVLGILKISRIAQLLVEQSPGIKQRRLNSAVLISAEGIRKGFDKRFHGVRLSILLIIQITESYDSSVKKGIFTFKLFVVSS